MTTHACPGYAVSRFPAEIISHTVGRYLRFSLTLRMVDELLAARSILVCYETERRSAPRFGQTSASQIRRRLPAAGDKLDILVQSRRDAEQQRGELAPADTAPRAAMKGFKSAGQAQHFLSARDGINKLFLLRRHQVPAAQSQAARSQTFQVRPRLPASLLQRNHEHAVPVAIHRNLGPIS